MNRADSRIPGAARIAALRANGLGDFIFTLPALHALRAAYPEAEIVLLGKQWHQDFLAGRPGPVDRVEVVPPAKGVSRPDTWDGQDAQSETLLEDFLRRMQAEQFDLALQLHGGGRHSNPFVGRLGARITAGMRAPGAPPLDRWTRYEYWQGEITRLLEVVQLVGARPVEIEPRIALTERDLRESCEAAPETGRPLVVLHPGAGDPRRRWPADRFAAVADALARRGCQIALVGVAEERPVARAVLESMRAEALDQCGALSLNGLAGLLARAALVIANDSGPRHLAEALGTPTVGLYWCGNLINAGPVFRTYHRPHLSWRLNCPVCGQNTLHDPCGHQESIVDEIPVDAVTASALDVLSLPPPRAPADD